MYYSIFIIHYTRVLKLTDGTNDDLFHRLKTVHFFRLFTGEGDMENTGQVIQNPEA